MAQRCLPALLSGLLLLSLLAAQAVSEPGDWRPVGVACTDVTPDYPIRLSGYASRASESQGVAQRIYAKAIAIGSPEDGVALLVTVDNCGVPKWLRDELARNLARKTGISTEWVTVSSTHTHSAPWIKGYLPNLFLEALPPDQISRIERYTAELLGKLEQVSLKALRSQHPALLSRGLGKAHFGANRRTANGPTDPDLPVIIAKGRDGRIRAIVAGYACHCTTLTGDFNQICGDWAGYAQEELEDNYNGAVALITVGCGGDINPNPRPGFELAKRHGAEIASGVKQVIDRPMTPIKGKLTCTTRTIELPFDTLPSRTEWETRATEPGYSGLHARINLARIARGESLPTTMPYMLQTWSFGDSFAMVFLPGEVVVDYAIRLKQECDASRLWVNAYANGVPCYIPSERVLKEGGYEGGGAMVYYDKPTRFASGLENRIVGHLREMLPSRIAKPFDSSAKGFK